MRALTRTETDRRGGPSKPPKLRRRRWKNTRTGKTEWVPQGIDPGWNYNPGQARMEMVTQRLAEKLRGAPTALARAGQPPIPLLTDDVVMGRPVEAARGSNPGGLYEGSDGARNCVKLYDEAGQAYTEAVADLAYRELWLLAPQTAPRRTILPAGMPGSRPRKSPKGAKSTVRRLPASTPLPRVCAGYILSFQSMAHRPDDLRILPNSVRNR